MMPPAPCARSRRAALRRAVALAGIVIVLAVLLRISASSSEHSLARSSQPAFVPAAAAALDSSRQGDPVAARSIHDVAEHEQMRGRVALRAQQAGSFLAIDETYNKQWLEIEEKPIAKLGWEHQQTGFAAAATAFYVFDMLRILCLVPPTAVEVMAIGMIYFGLYGSRHQEVPDLAPHYQVSFYASLGWTFYAWASLVHAMAYSPNPVLPMNLADPIHTLGCYVYLASCLYFYTYHWGRQVRHVIQGRFRPWFAVGLASLTAVHSLTVGHILKMLDDPGWLPTIIKIYSDEWRWIADTRLLELYLTAAALFLVILHLKGVLTGTKNAAAVFLGTVILPTAALFMETYTLDACAWQHFFMVGPKYF
mmetsp:Transcript_57124/g.161997  ORF Transcript_57124/g.161997 Transcript_57124/m.161997 type:complete len:365 (+) Transcript_57124:53-1147(+)